MGNNNKVITYDDVSLGYRRLFRIVGILPFDRSTTFHTIIYYLLAIYFYLINFTYSTMYLGHGLRMLARNEFELEFIFEVVIVQGICVRFFILYIRRQEFSRLMRNCGELWMLLIDADEPRVVKSFERKVRYLGYMTFWTMILSASGYIFMAHLVTLPPDVANGTERRVLPFRWYVEVQDQTWFEIVSIVQEIVAYSFAVDLTVTEVAGPFLIMMACGYLRSIQNRLLAMGKETPNVNVLMNNYNTIQYNGDQAKKLSTRYVVKCVKFHQKILDFCQDIENFTRALFMIQIMSTVYNMSLVGLKLLENDKRALKFLSVLIMNLLQFFICQWIPQHLLNESNAIIDAAYSATLVHPEFEPEANRALLFMMVRANNPIQLTAVGIVNLSLETFKRMSTSAVSFLTLLRSLNN